MPDLHLAMRKGRITIRTRAMQVYAIGNPFGLDHTLTQVRTASAALCILIAIFPFLVGWRHGQSLDSAAQPLLHIHADFWGAQHIFAHLQLPDESPDNIPQ